MEILRCKVGKLCNVDDDDFEVLFKTFFSLRERERERERERIIITFDIRAWDEMKIVILGKLCSSKSIHEYFTIRETYQRDL